jgi:hypothetical protein
LLHSVPFLWGELCPKQLGEAKRVGCAVPSLVPSIWAKTKSRINDWFILKKSLDSKFIVQQVFIQSLCSRTLIVLFDWPVLCDICLFRLWG